MKRLTQYSLTPCQNDAARAIIRWASDWDKLFMTLAGPAGTGKSWLSRFILDNIPNMRVCVSAPTHKALKEVKKASQRQGKTLQSLLGLAVNQDVEDFDPVNVKFDKHNRPCIEDFDLILLDEASMVQSTLREFLQKEAVKSRTKILFVGDPIQLPPVNETISTVFQDQHIDGGVQYLSTPCRQSTANPAYSLLLADRNDIEQSDEALRVLLNHLDDRCILNEELTKTLLNNRDNTYKVLRNHLGDYQCNVDGEGYKIYKDKREFLKQMNKTFVSYLNNKDYDGVRALAWTNRRVGDFNKIIRKTLFPTTNEAVTYGDLLMCYRPVTRYDAATRTQYTIIHNSEEVLVQAADNVQSNVGLSIYNTLVESIGRDNGKDEDYSLDFVNPIDYDEYIKTFRTYKDNAIATRAWRNFYGFYDNHLLLDNLQKKFDNRSLPNKAFDYAYALTVHKSQGSTFNEVFIDISDILYHYIVNKSMLENNGGWNDDADCTYRRITRQLRYVAASRAKKFTHFLM